jgi:uncharacterized membrane protein
MDTQYGPRPTPIDDTIERAARGAVFGLVLGVMMTGVGLLRAGSAALLTRHVSSGTGQGLGGVAGYVGAFAAAGAILGMLWPLKRSKVGAFVLGYLGAGIVCSAVGYLSEIREPHWNWTEFLVLAGIMTVVVGTAAGIQLNEKNEHMRTR